MYFMFAARLLRYTQFIHASQTLQTGVAVRNGHPLTCRHRSDAGMNRNTQHSDWLWLMTSIHSGEQGRALTQAMGAL